MARELILVPKIKYEGLLEKLKLNATNVADGQNINSAPVNGKTCDSFINDIEPCAEKAPCSDDNVAFVKKKRKSQTGKGLIMKAKFIGKPPGKSAKKQKKIKWLIY